MASRRAVQQPPSSLWSGHERLRIGERLQASLAGLWELDLLREMQKANVESALAVAPGLRSEDHPNGFGDGKLTHPNGVKLGRNKVEYVLGGGEDRCGLYASSENMELCVPVEDGADKEGLGLRMMGEESKKAGTNGGDATEVTEADSRPSSGFYETSEMGSLSDSCASVHSDGAGASRCSIGSLPHLPGLRENGLIRPRSTDEAAVRLLDLQLQRLTLASVAGTDNRRPVSTGDLEFLLGLGSLPFPRPPNFQLLRYKSDLVSRNTNEIYHYPSPLHAVALQSPLFTNGLSQSSSQEDLDEMPPKVPKFDSPKRRDPLCSEELLKIRLDQYLAKLVLRYKCRTAASRTESGYLAGNQKSLSMTSICSSGQVAGQVLGPIPGWKIRRRISTCSHLRSPEGSEGARDSRVLDGLWDFPPFPEVSLFQSSTTNLVKPSESSVISLPSPQDASVKLILNKTSVTPDRKIWAAGPHQLIIKTESSFRKECSLPPGMTGVDKLYKGKHASRELVKTSERAEKAAERSWLSPRELLRRLSLRRKPSSRTVGRARASSEINVHAAAGLVCPSQLQTNCGKAIKPKWTSVLEISSKTSGRHRAKAGGMFLPPAALNRNLAFSSDAPSTFCFPEDGCFDLPPRQRARLPGNGSRLSEVEATSAVSLNGDWMFHQLGDRWIHGSTTLDSSDLPPHNFKLRRSRSFKELKKMVSRSFKSSRTAK